MESRGRVGHDTAHYAETAPPALRAPWRDELIPPALRLPAIAAIIACAVVSAILAAQFAGTHRAGGVDRAADAKLQHRFGDHLHIMQGLRALGSPVAVIAICVLLCLALAAFHRWRLAAMCIIGPLMVGVTVDVLKPILGRRFHGFFSFPSGHTAGATAVAILVILILIAMPLPTARPSPTRTTAIIVRVAVGLLALLYIAGVATAMVVLDNHYFTDTAGGFAVGTGVMLVVALVIDWMRSIDPSTQQT